MFLVNCQILLQTSLNISKVISVSASYDSQTTKLLATLNLRWCTNDIWIFSSSHPIFPFLKQICNSNKLTNKITNKYVQCATIFFGEYNMYESTILYNTYILYLLNINCTAYIFIYLIPLSTENNSYSLGCLTSKTNHCPSQLLCLRYSYM